MAACAAFVLMAESCGVDREACSKVDMLPAPETRLFYQGQNCPGEYVSLPFDASRGLVRYATVAVLDNQIAISALHTGQEMLGPPGNHTFCAGSGTGQPQLQFRVPVVGGEGGAVVLVRFRDPGKSTAIVYVEPLPGG
jgi:hypothetical protein